MSLVTSSIEGSGQKGLEGEEHGISKVFKTQLNPSKLLLLYGLNSCIHKEYSSTVTMDKRKKIVNKSA